MIHRVTYKNGSVNIGGQDILNLDHLKIPFQVNVLVDVVSGTANYSVEFTTDDMDNDPSLLRWTNFSAFPAGQTATQQFTINFPVTAVRLNIVTITGEIRLTTLQGTGV